MITSAPPLYYPLGALGIFGFWLLGVSTYSRNRKKRVSASANFFETRAYEIATAKGIWVITLAIITGAAVLATISLVFDADLSDSIRLYLRLGVAPPFVFALWFCAVQYGRERKLEEEYSFKGRMWEAIEHFGEIYSRTLGAVGSTPQASESVGAFVTAAAQQVFISPQSSSTIDLSDKGLIPAGLKDVAQKSAELAETISKVLKS
jgi:hypothetical protein